MRFFSAHMISTKPFWLCLLLITASINFLDRAQAFPSETNHRRVAFERFSVAVGQQCAMRKAIDIPPATLLDMADRFREGRSNRERAAFDAYAMRKADGSFTACEAVDGARCSANESIYGFYRAGKIDEFAKFVCRNAD